ncbi:MAG TPA: AMP-binding protein, partial [Burkholderiaceae bacterium]
MPAAQQEAAPQVVEAPTSGGADAPSAPADAGALLDVVRELVAELGAGRAAPLSLDDTLESDLGIDSLARMELGLRIERGLGRRIGDPALLEAESVRDLLRALRAAPPGSRPLVKGETAPSPPPAADGDAVALPSGARTLVDVLQWHALRTPERTHVKLLRQGEPIAELTHASLHRRARGLAQALREFGVARGDTVALMLPTGAPMLECFMGVLVAGATPVPIYPPARAREIEEHLRRQSGILGSARATLLVCEASALPAARILRLGVRSLRAAVTPEDLVSRSGARASTDLPGESDVALVQYTSGSTGQPKGVVLTHANLLADIRAMGEAIGATSADVFVSWLPLYHDMGLIGAWLGCLYHGIPLVLMPPQDFLARPARWLRAIDDHRGTLTAGPNFAYDIVATRVPDGELEGLDLRCLRGAMNGSEAVRAATLEAFCARFERRGFDRRALWPVYGLAECGVGLTFPPPGRGPRIDRIDPRGLRERGVAVPSVEASAASVVCCGMPLPSHELRVVDDRGSELPDRREGRIQFRGPAATSGYLRNAEATRRLFDGDWIETGDLGYVADGELFVTGRLKDMIKHAGHNLHPDDLESAVGALPGVRRGCVAVFGSDDAGPRGERIVVVAETRL